MNPMYLIIAFLVGLLLAGCADADKRGVADVEGSRFAHGDDARSVRIKPVRRGLGIPTGRYGRPATELALQITCVAHFMPSGGASTPSHLAGDATKTLRHRRELEAAGVLLVECFHLPSPHIPG